MKKRVMGLSALLFVALDASAADGLAGLLEGGKASLQVRPRYEFVDDDAMAAADPARALTVRSVLGFRTAPVAGITAGVEIEDIRALVDDYHVPVVQPDPGHAVVVDPEGTAVNQAWVAGHGFRLGRQKLVFGNARFIGDVAWRQDDQTFTALAWERASLLGWLDAQAAWAGRVALVNGQAADIRLPVLNLRARTPVGASVTLFWAGLDGREADALAPATAGLKANMGRDKGREYRVLRVDGRHGGWRYDLALGRQTRHGDGSRAAVPDAGYSDIQLGYDFGRVTVTLQQERLAAGFQTPLATLHAFNGWADRFLVTPADGLTDRNIKVGGRVAGFTLALAAHRFSADAGGAGFGREVDVSIGRVFSPNWSGLIKLARYDGGGDSRLPAAQAAYGRDLTKAWLQLDYRF